MYPILERETKRAADEFGFIDPITIMLISQAIIALVKFVLWLCENLDYTAVAERSADFAHGDNNRQLRCAIRERIGTHGFFKIGGLRFITYVLRRARELTAVEFQQLADEVSTAEFNLPESP